jgi:hypothetical protein
MLNSYSLDDHQLKVALVKPREQRGFGTTHWDGITDRL